MMFDLKKFQEIWRSARAIGYQRNTSTNFHCSYLDAFLIKDLIDKNYIEEFVSMMYANALFVQVAFRWVEYGGLQFKTTDEVENTFPRVNGILSTVNKHVCPAVMPSMLLYLDESTIVQDGDLKYSMRDAEKELKIWAGKTEIFDNGISQAICNIDQLLQILLEDNSISKKDLIFGVMKSHEYIKNSISNKNEAGRILNY